MKRKTYNITRNRTWNDPIGRWNIWHFLLHIFSNDIWHSEVKYPYSFDKISLLTTPWMHKWHFRIQELRFKDSRRERKKRIQGFRCLNSLITQNIQEYDFPRRERIYNILKLGVTFGTSPWWDQRSWWNPKRRILMVKMRPSNLHQSGAIPPRYRVKRERSEILFV